MKEANLSKEQILNEIRNSPHLKVKVAVADIDGILRGKVMRKDKFLSAVESGFGFCDVVFGWDSGDVAYDNVTYTGWHTGYPDAQARIDLGTYRQVPWQDDLTFLPCRFSRCEGRAAPSMSAQPAQNRPRPCRADGLQAFLLARVRVVQFP
jgi:glutamine synthetase